MTTTDTLTPPAVLARMPRSWPVLLLAAPAFVAIWSGWVGLGTLTGFGEVRPLPGIWDSARIDTAITLPVGVETYAAYALHVWLSRTVDARAARFAKWSALGSLVLGAAGQVAYHLMVAAGMSAAPWQITALVACLPVAVLGMGAALAHLVAHAEPALPQSAAPTPAAEPRDDGADDGADERADDLAELESAEVPAPRAAPRLPVPDAAPATKAAPRGGGRPAGSSVAVRVRALRAKHPQWTTEQIATRAQCSPRTVRRHLNTTPDPADSTAAAAA